MAHPVYYHMCQDNNSELLSDMLDMLTKNKRFQCFRKKTSPVLT